jgi:hypothetical protein
MLLTLLSWRASGRALVSRFGAYAAGAVTVFAGILGFLRAYGDLRGFYHWGVGFALGPYAKLRFSAALQRDWWVGIFVRLPMRPVLTLCVVGVIVFAIIAAASALRMARAERGAAAGAAESAWRAIQLVVLVFLIGLTIYVQGKTHCIYHFIPLKWGLTLFGAALAGKPWPWGHLRWGPPLRAVLAGASFVYGISYFAKQERELVTAGEISARNAFADQLASALAPGETIVLFGFKPSILCALERPTPMPFVDSWIMYAGAPEGSVFREEFMRRWEEAMADPSVRFFIVQPGLQLFPGQRFDPNRPELSDAVVRERFPAERLKALGFAPSKAFPGSPSGLIVYDRVRG